MAHYFAIDLQHGTLLHVLNGDDESKRFMRHHFESTGERPAIVQWTPGSVTVLDGGAA